MHCFVQAMVLIKVNFIYLFILSLLEVYTQKSGFGKSCQSKKCLLAGCVNTLPLRDHVESTKRYNDRGMKNYDVDAIKEGRQRKVNWCVLLISLSVGCSCFTSHNANPAVPVYKTLLPQESNWEYPGTSVSHWQRHSLYRGSHGKGDHHRGMTIFFRATVFQSRPDRKPQKAAILPIFPYTEIYTRRDVLPWGLWVNWKYVGYVVRKIWPFGG